MSARTRRWPLVLERAAKVPDGAGGVVTGWTAQGTLWADVQIAGGRETLVGPRGASVQEYRITVPATPHGASSRPTAQDRFRHGARVFHILAVGEVDAKGRLLRCRAVEEATP
jgi:head-tail adaptor